MFDSNNQILQAENDDFLDIGNSPNTIIDKSLINSQLEENIENEIRRQTQTYRQSLLPKSDLLDHQSFIEIIKKEEEEKKSQTKLESSQNQTNAKMNENQQNQMIPEIKTEGAGMLQTDEYIYNGQWNRNKFNGYGRIIKKKFALYEGIFVNNKRDGYGVEIYANSDIYIGQFKSDKKHGIGIYFFSIGGYFYGQFENGFRSGFGTLYNKGNRNAFIGFWKNDLREGRGVEIYKNGSKYDGFLAQDKRDGVGFMEYSKSLHYLGEWKSGFKHGIGRVEHNKQTISGKFAKDVFLEPVFYNISQHTDKLSQCRIESTMEEFLQKKNSEFKRSFVKNYGEVYASVKDSLVSHVLDLVEKGVLRLSSYLKIKSIFTKSSRFEYFIDDILYLLKSEPNIEKQGIYWDPEQREFMIGKSNFFWEKSELLIKKSKALFDETLLNQETLDIQLVKLNTNVQAVITNEIFCGQTQIEDLEGVIKDEKFSLRVYNKTTNELERTEQATIFPFFIHFKTKTQQFIYSMNPQLYTGEFFFGKDIKKPLKMSLFLCLDSENMWYSVGIDAVGVFTLTGKLDRARSTGQILQTYVQDYKIQYNMFLANSEKLQGNWNTTNMNGHFILRRDSNFRFSEKLSKIFNKIEIAKKDFSAEDFLDIDELSVFLKNSILGVITKGTQGGIPAHYRSKDDSDLDSLLFEKFKKQKTENFEEVQANKSHETSFRKEDSKNDSLMDVSCNAEGSKHDSELLEVKINISKMNRMSLELLNLKALEQNVNLKHNSENKIVTFEPKLQVFQEKLVNSIKGLRKLFHEGLNAVYQKTEENTENISWVGRIITLGREETIIFDHLYIIEDVIEGVLTDEQGIVFEIAGSYSARTCEFELVGMSLDKKKTMKVKGALDNFVLKGILSKKPEMQASSQVQLKFFGISAKVDLSKEEHSINLKGLEGYIKVTNTYIYGFILFEKEVLIISGIKHPEFGYGIEISCHNKKLKGSTAVQINFGNDENDKRMEFKSEHLSLIVFFEKK